LRVVAALIEKDQRILIARRGRDKRFAWQWEFPGGKIRPDEQPEHCLQREIMEELNLQVRITGHFQTVSYCYEDFSVELLVYWCSIEAGTLHLNEHEEIKWVTVAEMQDYDFVAADLQVIESLSRYFGLPVDQAPGFRD